MIQQPTNHLLEWSLNHCVNYDEQLKNQLMSLNNRTIALTIEEWQWSLYLSIKHNQILIENQRPEHLDTIIRGQLNDFLNLSGIPLLQRKSHKNTLHFEGDVEVGLKLKQILSEADIDWATMLSDQVGEVAGSWISQMGRVGLKTLSHFTQQTQDNLRDINIDAYWAPTQSQCQSLIDAIQQLQIRIQHCENRIHAIRLKHSAAPPLHDT